jgi:hypothetical protein
VGKEKFIEISWSTKLNKHTKQMDQSHQTKKSP